MTSWHARDWPDVAADLASDAARGLSHDDARERLARYGPNALAEAKTHSWLQVLARQFKSPLIYLLLAAAVIAFALGERSDAAVIAVVVLLNAAVGAIQEGRAQRSLEALRRLAGQRARVVRDGREEVLDARDLVPGDVLLMAAGDAVPADARLVEAAALRVAEAALTGESLPVTKTTEPQPTEAPLADRRSMIYAGTQVAAGRGRALVVATGPMTEIGRIAALAGAAVEPKTPLEKRISAFGRQVIVVAAILFVAVFALGLARGIAYGQMAMLAISQVVGLIPEGLPVAMTIALAVGVQRMAARRAIVRRLAAVETLGSTTVICTDKTGTLTSNEMTVTAVYLPGRGRISVSGVGYAPAGELREGGRILTADEDPALAALLRAAVLCNDARIGPEEAGSRWGALGDPTEAALLTLAAKAGMPDGPSRAAFPRRAEIPFDSATKMMATEHQTPEGLRVFIKGAPEAVARLSRHPPDDARAAAIEMAGQALRVLAFGVVEGVEIRNDEGVEPFAGRVTFLGLVGQMDLPRPEVDNAVRACFSAGIRPVMVTGDHQVTALAVARSLGIARPGDEAVDGVELDRLSDEDLAAACDRISVFARVHPAQKLRIVEAYQRRGGVVAMTGDGVNDAPALVRADVGVAMGITGTDAAKEAADVVITDDNFSTIVSAVEEGRVVYRNIKKALLLLVSTAFAEVAVLLLAMVFGYPPPFAAVQILWNNLVTEGLVTVNLILDPPEGSEMRGPPLKPGDPLLDRPVLARVAVMTPAIVLCTLGWFAFRLSSGVPLAQTQSETFTLLAVCEWYNVLSCRSETRSALNLGILRNRWLLFGLILGNLLQVAVIYVPAMNRIFHTVPLGWQQVVAIGVVGSLVLWAEEIRKAIVRHRAERARNAHRGSMPAQAAPGR